MTDSLSILELPGREWCRHLDALLAHLPPSTPNEHAPRGDAAVDWLSGLPAPLLDDLAAAVASPVQVVADERWRAVVVLRVYVAVTELHSGLVRPALLRDGGRLSAIAEPEPGVRLLNSPQGSHWPHFWLRAWCWRQGASLAPSVLFRSVADAAPAVWRHTWRHLDLRGMRRQVAAAMDYEPTAWRRAVRLAHTLNRGPDHRHYNVALRFSGQLDLLEREAPNLMAPWLVLACDRALDPRQEPKAALKRWVRAIGASSRAWKSLAASPTRVWAAWPKRRAPGGESLQETVELVDRCATAEPIPLAVVRALTDRLDPLVPLCEARTGHYPFAVRAAAAALGGGNWPRFIDDLDAVDDWFHIERPVLDKLQRRRGWPWLVRKARAWAEMRRRQELAREPLIPELPALEISDFVFTAARTPFDLWNAGRLLRNCLGTPGYQRDQGQSWFLLVLATRRVDGRLRAAIALRERPPGGGLAVNEARGFANGPCPRELRQLLPRVTEHFDRARRGRLLPWRITGRRPAAPPLARCPLPLKAPFGMGELRLTASGSVQIGQLLRDYTTRPIGERFEPMWLIRGGQAQRLAERAVEQAGGRIESLDALAAAIAAVLSAPPRLDHWLVAYDAQVPSWYEEDDEHVAEEQQSEPEEPPLDERSREAVLDLLDHLARDSRERERRGKRQRSAA